MNNISRRNDHLGFWADTFSGRRPALYLGLVLAVMMLGYAFIFMFPYLALKSASVLIEEISNMETTGQWVVAAIWFVVLVSCLFLSWKIAQLHFPRVQGLKLTRELAPDLYRLVAEVGKYTTPSTIRNIVLTDQYELRIEQTPRFGYPFGLDSVLVVGMPMLQTLSEEQFRCELLRRFGQYSGGRFRLSHWVFRARLLWRQYLDALVKHKSPGNLLMRWFFSIYTPLFDALALPVVRKDELVGDSCVLEWVNDRDYFDAVMSSTFAKSFLGGHYWRKVYQSALKTPKVVQKPFENLEHISGHLQSKAFRRKLLESAFSAEQNCFEPMPSLSVRMENIGQSKLRDMPVLDRTAAQVLLSDARKDIVPMMDELWYSTTFSHWKARYDKGLENLEMAKKISRKSQHKALSIKEVLLYAWLAKQLRGDSLRGSCTKMFKRNVKNSFLAPLIRVLFPRKVDATFKTE